MSNQPAFPLADSMAEYKNTDRENCNGMTLRDYFAAKALPSIYRDLWDDVRAGRCNSVPADWKTGIAIDAYAMADAMMKERAKPCS